MVQKALGIEEGILRSRINSLCLPTGTVNEKEETGLNWNFTNNIWNAGENTILGENYKRADNSEAQLKFKLLSIYTA